MRNGSMHKLGDVILAEVQFTDTFEIKARPAVVLFEELGNIVIAGITSNTEMKGIPLAKKEGAVKDSVIKLNYIFTISEKMVKKRLFELNEDKKKLVVSWIMKRLEAESMFGALKGKIGSSSRKAGNCGRVTGQATRIRGKNNHIPNRKT